MSPAVSPAGPQDGRPARPSPAPRGERGLLDQERASFGVAFQGLWWALRSQRHLRIHLTVAVAAALLGLALGLSAIEWAILCLATSLVISLELLNTVVEVIVDMIHPDVHPQAKLAKDVAAGAVLVAAIGAVAIGACLFLPRLGGLLRP